MFPPHFKDLFARSCRSSVSSCGRLSSHAAVLCGTGGPKKPPALCWETSLPAQTGLALLLRMSAQRSLSRHPSRVFPGTRHSSSLEKSAPLSLCRVSACPPLLLWLTALAALRLCTVAPEAPSLPWPGGALCQSPAFSLC